MHMHLNDWAVTQSLTHKCLASGNLGNLGKFGNFGNLRIFGNLGNFGNGGNVGKIAYFTYIDMLYAIFGWLRVIFNIVFGDFVHLADMYGKKFCSF